MSMSKTEIIATIVIIAYLISLFVVAVREFIR
jgi:hypothetical protein